MKKRLIPLFFLLLNFHFLTSQSCNDLGVWMWHFEYTEFESHDSLADSLSSMGVKRLYVKVADGRVDSAFWPEIIDTELVEVYHNYDMEVWAWSYNYPFYFIEQSEALYHAAKTGYDGYVVDVEMLFDGDEESAESLFSAFYSARTMAQDEGIIDTFPIYCTTWGNPGLHNFPINVIDPYIDGWMPQTYLEVWSGNKLDDIDYWIEVGNQDYAALGATKPLHHIAAMQDGTMTGTQVNEFFQASGPESSIWRIPGYGTPLSIWDEWDFVHWNHNFCEITSNKNQPKNKLILYPNPAQDHVFIKGDFSTFQAHILSYHGLSIPVKIDNGRIDVSMLHSGLYILRLVSETEVTSTIFNVIR